MPTPQGPDRPLLLFADDGAPAADVAWAWITSHDWIGWALETVTTTMTLYPGGPEIGHAVHVSRQPPAETRFTGSDHIDMEGDPRLVIRGRSDATLVVVGCRHRGHLAGLLAGSTTEWLLGAPPVPLVVARHGHRTRSVAICVDGGRHSQRALEAFLALPWSSDVEVALVSVADGATDVETALAEAVAAFPEEHPPTTHRLAGKPKREVPNFVRSREIDLVILGTRGLTGLSRLRVGSTVSALIKDEAANLIVAHVAEEPA
jgi:nucleotide-binding universal stress UspA family protein